MKAGSENKSATSDWTRLDYEISLGRVGKGKRDESNMNNTEKRVYNWEEGELLLFMRNWKDGRLHVPTSTSYL